MQKIMLGKSGIEVSEMCFGTLTVGPVQAAMSVEQGAQVLAYAINKGINFFDTAQLYQTYPYIKEAMRISGKYDIVISSKTYAYTKELAEQAVEQARKELNRDYIDIFMLHEQESIHTLRGHEPALERLMEYKQKGIIKAVGASMHHVAAVNGAVKYGLDIIHPILNKAGLGIVDGTRQDMEEAVKRAYEAGTGIFTMKALGGGNLFKSAEECFDYIKSLDYIHSVAVGMQSTSEVDANLEYFSKGRFSPKAKEYLEHKVRAIHIDDWCEGCGKCAARCAHKAMSINEDGKAVCDIGKCILCGYCSSVCPAWAIKVV